MVMPAAAPMVMPAAAPMVMPAAAPVPGLPPLVMQPAPVAAPAMVAGQVSAPDASGF
jgi:hypothetical protein